MLDQEEYFHRGGGGGGVNSASVGPPCAAYMSACCRCSARYCIAGLANTVGGNGNELTRCRSRNTLTKLFHAYLVKPLSLLPVPGEGEAIRSISSDPPKPHICIHIGKQRGTNSSRLSRMMVSASKLSSERMHLALL